MAGAAAGRRFSLAHNWNHIVT